MDDLERFFLESIEWGESKVMPLKTDAQDESLVMQAFYLRRMIDHMHSAKALLRSSDLILIARTVYEGFLNLEYARKEKLCENWRLYGVILDQQKIENGMRPPEIVQELIDKNLSRAQEVFKKNNKGEYPPSWRGYVSIYSMAQKVGSPLLELYEEYRDMSDYHHWGIQSLGGGRYKFDPEGRIFKDHVVDEFIIARCLYLILYSFFYMAGVFAISRSNEQVAEEAMIKSFEVKEIYRRFPRSFS